MIGRKIFIILILIVSSFSCFAQKVHVKASNEALSSVIKRLNTEVSFDNKLLSTYKVTVDRTFTSPYKALVFLIAGKPLQVQKVAGVYIITAKQKSTKPDLQPVRKTSYKHVVTKIPVPPSIDLAVSLKEIVITARNHTPYLKGEEDDGTSRFNSFTANAMPGHSDNLVFNVLRMMPGIRASGEPSDELYVWGSSPGESRVYFDGIPFFTLQSYNSNISYINPYMFDEVRYKRGVLSASEGSQTGATIDVLSSMSRAARPVFKAMLSTMSANCFGMIPLGRNNVISMAYRHTLGDLFGGTSFDAYRGKKEKGDDAESKDSGSNTTGTTNEQNNNTETHSISETTTITPEYRFQDINLNFTGLSERNTSYRVSMYGAKDYLDYEDADSLSAFGKQTSYQGGISTLLEKQWNNGNKSEITSFVSGLYSKQSGIADSIGFASNERVSQYNIKMQQTGLQKNTGLSFGGEFQVYHVGSSFVNTTTVQPTLFASQKFSMKGLNIEAGLRTDFMSKGIKWQPRFMLKYHFLSHFTFTSAWGIYNQYLVKNPFAIAQGNYNFSWDINTSLKSYNTVAGIAYDRGGLNISVESYMKNIRHSQWVVDDKLGMYNFNLKGIDVSVKYNWRHGLSFASWSVANDPRQTDDVSNELKIGSILRFYPFTFSANYVYSSGYNALLLPASSYEKHEGKEQGNYNDIHYSRFDISASYEKSFGSLVFTTGASIINVFDTNNQKYATTWVPRKYSSTFSARASRFTPLIFIAVKF